MGSGRGVSGRVGIAALLCLASAAAGHASPLLEVMSSPAVPGPTMGASQRDSLAHVFYRGNDLPPAPDTAELRRLEARLHSAPPYEVAELRRLFGEDRELLAYAVRDTDGDGVRDFRISEYRGRFFEGDLDLDGDGVDNVFDAAPYDPDTGGTDTDGDSAPDTGFADADGDGVPDHLDLWPTGSELDDIQQGLLADFDLILLERSGRITLPLARAVDDMVRVIHGTVPVTLRTVAVEERLLLSGDPEDHGLMLGQTRTLTVCTAGLDGAEPLLLLGLLAHEMDHAFQLALDYDLEHPLVENQREHFPHGAFAESLEPFGWTLDERTGEPGEPHVLYTPQFTMSGPEYRYLGATPRWWSRWLARMEDTSGDAYLRDRRLVRLGVVGPYSLTTPWEWRADHATASLYNRMEAHLSLHPSAWVAVSSTELSGRMLRATRAYWPYYDYRNAAHTPIADHLARARPLSDAALTHLVDRYVVPLGD